MQSLSNAFRHGVGLKNIYTAFLCSALMRMGDYRRGLRAACIRAISRFAVGGQIPLRIKIQKKVVTFHMRKGNIADYLIAGEMVQGEYQLPTTLPSRPTAIVDGGANIGMFSLISHSYFPELPVICYEPDKENLVQLNKNLQFNGIKAKVIGKALWSEEETLYYHPSLSYAGKVSREPSPYPMECCKPEVPAGCWLKLDIEGAEYEVLPVVLANDSRPLLISLEIHYFSERGQSIIDLLQAYNYKIYGNYSPDDACVNITAVASGIA